MARIAYRLWAIKDESQYIDAGYTMEEATAIINEAYEIDEDYLRKSDYIKAAKLEAEGITKRLNLKQPLDWVLLFGEPVDIDYRYCSKCDTYFWLGDPCECED